MNSRVGVTIMVVALLVTGSGPVAAATGATDPSRTQSNPFELQDTQLDADEVRMDVALQPNGTAEWTLEFWVRLDDTESTTAFESLRDDIQDDPGNYTQSFADRMTETVAAAQNATGREMSADGFAVETERQSFAREYGVVRYTFRWHGFAAVDGNELRAGDAIEGIYLDDGTRLLFEWPDGYEQTSVTPDPDENRETVVIWRGESTDFISGEPRVVVTSGGPFSTATVVGAAVVVVALGVVGAWWYRNRASAAGLAVGNRSDPDPAAESEPESQSTVTADDSAATDSEASATGTPATELLSNEEQVLRLVRDNGGRMKQQAVVEELGWTDAKTSKVVSGLREEGDLESFRLGRENVLSLPEADELTMETDSDSEQ